jgi:DUF438 domain-containing protein
MSESMGDRTERIQELKRIIKHLHEGKPPEAVKVELAAIVRHSEASEIAEMEQQLIAEGMSVDEIRSMCDLHAAVVRDIITEPREPILLPGHPIDTFRRENEALHKTVTVIRQAIEEIRAMPDDSSPNAVLEQWQEAHNALMDVDKHYSRKENLLFACLERHGITGPPQVMWAKDDEVRDLLEPLGEALRDQNPTAGRLKGIADKLAKPALDAVEEMITKEEKILFPMALKLLTDQEWGEIWTQSPEYGWCLVEPREGYKPPVSDEPEAAAGRGRALLFPTGALTADQLLGIFAALPVDVTFVDADDRVRYFSPGPERIFARSKAIIGRKVHHCHPPKSVDVVERILDDFRSGRRSQTEFWIEIGGRFIYIRYLAVRDPERKYLGTLEVTQDITRARALRGERRLLSYGDSTEGDSR